MVKQVPAAAALSGAGTLTAGAFKSVPAAAAMAGSGSLTAGAAKSAPVATSLAPSNLTSGHAEGVTVTGFTTASISPAGNSLLTLSVGGFDGTGSQDFTVSAVTGFGATWTRQKLGVAGGTPKGDVEAWTAKMPATPGSGTITATLTIAISGGLAWSADQFTGQDPATPVVAGNIVAANASSAASSVTYGAAASGSNLFYYLSVVLLGGGGTATQAPSETPAWTSLASLQSDTTTFNGVSLSTQVSPDVTHLTGSASWSGSHSWGTIGLEIAASSGTEHDAAASLSGSGTMTAGASKSVPVAAALAGSGTLTAGAAKLVPAAASLSGSGSLTAGTTATRVAAASLSGSGSLTAGMVKQVPAAAALTGSGTLTAAAAKLVPAAASLSGSGTLTAAALKSVPAAAPLSGLGTLTAAAGVTHLQAAAALSGTGTLTAAASKRTAGRIILVTLGRARIPWSLGHARND